jgi:hypothetical protein
MQLATAGAEALLAERTLTSLSSHFLITEQVIGTHPSGKRLRIDAILRPRDPSPWSRANIALGVEFKAPTDRDDERRDRKANAKIISQCIDYSLVEWDGFEQVPVFFCPGFAEITALRERNDLLSLQSTDYHEGFKHGVGFLMAAVMGQNNVGELVHSNHLGWAFLINGHHRIWSERYGLGEGKRNKLIRTVGSR